jgi:hypothetical protein
MQCRNTVACQEKIGRPPCHTIWGRMKILGLGDGRLQDIRSLRPLCPLHDLKLDVFSFFQTLESFSLQRRIVYEDIVSTLKTNEPKSLAIVEPLDRTFRLHRNPLSSTATPSYVAGSGTQLATHGMNRKQQGEDQVETTGSLERQNRPQRPSWFELAQHVPWHFKSCQAILWPEACRECDGSEVDNPRPLAYI